MFCFVFNLRRHIEVWCDFAYEESWFRFTLLGYVILFISIKCGLYLFSSYIQLLILLHMQWPNIMLVSLSAMGRKY